MKDLAAKCC